MAVLLDLPQELLVRIASHLTTAELGTLRRTCTAVEEGLFKTFAREFFTKRQFMIEHVSLQALVDIANHKTLAPYLKEVIIATQQLYYDPDLLGHQGGRHREAGYMERSLFLATGQAHAMLVEAFSKLPNLQTVGLRDYDGAGRLRDGECARWKSYGWSFDDPAAISIWPRTQQPHLPGPIFGPLLFALGKAQSNIESVEVFLRRRYQLTLSSFDIVQGPMGDTVNPVLGRLKKLMLAIGLNDDPRPGGETFGDPWGPDYKEDRDVATKSLKAFLCQTRNLNTLRLNFVPTQYYGQRLLEWLGRPANSSTAKSSLVPPVGLASLTCLDLGMVTVQPKTLIKVITKFDSLQSVNLWKICLHEILAPPSDTNYMATFLSGLRIALPSHCSIAHFLIGYASQLESPPSDHIQKPNRVYFALDGNSRNEAFSNRDNLARYTAHFGSGLKRWLEETSRSSFVLHPHDPNEEDWDEESDREESDEYQSEMEEFFEELSENESEMDD